MHHKRSAKSKSHVWLFYLSLSAWTICNIKSKSTITSFYPGPIWQCWTVSDATHNKRVCVCVCQHQGSRWALPRARLSARCQALLIRARASLQRFCTDGSDTSLWGRSTCVQQGLGWELKSGSNCWLKDFKFLCADIRNVVIIMHCSLSSYLKNIFPCVV